MYDHIKPHEVITADRSSIWLNLYQMWKQRDLIRMLTMRSIRGRYQQSLLGIFWALITPVCYMVILNVFFGLLGGFSSGDETPYSIFLLAAIVPYQFFAKCLGDGAGAVLSNEALIGKVYFPRIIFPIVTTLSASVDFIIAFLFFCVCFVVLKQPIDMHLLVLPVAILGVAILGAASAVFVSALTVKYRDVRYALPTITQLMFFGSPVWYPSTIVPEKYHILWGINPLAGVIEGFRWCFFGTETASVKLIISSTVTTIFVGIFGIIYFNKIQRELSDMI